MLKRILVGVIVIAVMVLAGFWFYANRSVKKAHARIPVGANKSLCNLACPKNWSRV